MMENEASIHQRVAQYLRENHPTVIFVTDFASGARMSWGLIKKNNAVKGKRGFPDMFIAEPVPAKDGSGYYCGLFLELKKDKIKIFKKDNTFVNEHYKEQYETLDALNEKGYYAVFAFGYEQAISIISAYLKGER
jgi:hypothetical protein